MKKHTLQIMTHAWRLLAFYVIGIALVGCAGTVGYKKLYNGPHKPLNEIALLTHQNPYMQTVLIYKIDGQTTLFSGLVELTPGLHIICAGFASGNQRSKGCSDIKFTAEAGHVYEIYHVPYTHKESWYPAILDITNDLDYPEKKELAKKIDDILKKHRGSDAVFDKAWSPPASEKLVGFGESVKSVIIGKYKKEVSIEYTFDRYKPYLVVEGDDGNYYHVEISTTTGKIVTIFGTRQSVGDWKIAHAAYQPFGSDLAYVYFDSNDWGNQGGTPRLVFKETSPNTFELVKKTYYARFNDYNVNSLLNAEDYEGLPDDAIRAMVMVRNANSDILLKDPLITVQLKREYVLNSMEYRFSVQELAINLGRESIRKAREVASGIPQNSIGYKKIEALINTGEEQLAKSIREDTALKFVPPLNPDATRLKFFESSSTLTDYQKRTYLPRFPRSKTRLVAWELSREIPKQTSYIQYEIYSVWKRPNGSIFTRQLNSTT
ncbi:hypothetical protein KKA14_00580, partial [bacterium]|nr:hypothetical protein [bacterium]